MKDTLVIVKVGAVREGVSCSDGLDVFGSITDGYRSHLLARYG